MSVQLVQAMFGAVIKFMPELSTSAFSAYTVCTTKGVHLFDLAVDNSTGKIEVIFLFPYSSEKIELERPAAFVTEISENGVTKRPSGASVQSIVYPQIIGLLASKMFG